MNKLVLIDGKSVFYRGYYAMGALSKADGTPTGGVYGFAAIAMEIVKRLGPTKVVVAWDSKSSTARRRAIYPEYKAGRHKPGEDFYVQIPLLKELVADLSWDFIEVENYEADDIIGTLSWQADETLDVDGKCIYETYIISSDLDMLQIVDENTRMLRIKKGFTDIEEINVPEIEAKYGIKKNQFLDLKALKGDASDNIPGVPGVGEKTAAKLLNDYGDLDGIYKHLDEISGSLHDKLVAGKELAYMSKELAQIDFNAPVKLSSVPDFEFNQEKMIEGLKKLEFNSLVKKFGGDLVRQATFSRTASGRPIAMGGRRLSSPCQAPDVLEKGLGRTNEPLKFLAPEILEWDVKEAMHADRKVAERVLKGEEFWDLSQAGFLLNPLERKEADLFDQDKERKYQEQRAEFEKLPRVYKVLTELDLPMIPVLYKMEKRGLKIDREYFQNLEQEYTKEVSKKEQEIWQLTGKEFNINSPIQLSEVLFTDLGLSTKGIKKTTRGYSTGAKELEKLRGEHPVIEKIMEYREMAKLLSTYIAPMPGLADGEDRIHTTFTQDVTATGRLSSKNPNLQNIPIRTEEGRRIRAGFVAPKGRSLVSADYSQFELRLAAALSNDEKLVEDFNAGVDVHTKTASEVFHVPFESVTKEQRRAAKVVNFGILYGMSVQGLAEAAKMPYAEAKEFTERYFELRSPIKKYLERILKQAREEGYVETYFGRRRPTPDVKSANFVVRSAAERAAMNMPIQGTEADLMKRAMILVDRKLPEGAEMVLQVHDSLVVECNEGLTDVVSKILKETMEGVAPELKVKLKVEVEIGKHM